MTSWLLQWLPFDHFTYKPLAQCLVTSRHLIIVLLDERTKKYFWKTNFLHLYLLSFQWPSNVEKASSSIPSLQLGRVRFVSDLPKVTESSWESQTWIQVFWLNNYCPYSQYLSLFLCHLPPSGFFFKFNAKNHFALHIWYSWQWVSIKEPKSHGWHEVHHML